MPVDTPKDPNPVIAVSGQLFDIVSNPADLNSFRIALRSWFTSYLTQTEDHVNHSSLAENIKYFEVLQEWLDSSMLATVATSSTINPPKRWKPN